MGTFIKLEPVIKDYPWGNDYFIADLLDIAHDGPKAELWVGAHKSGSSIIDCANGACNGTCCRGLNLDDYIDSNPAFVGLKNSSEFPFLLKVLAIGGALSLQCHPNKEQAKLGYERERKNLVENNSNNSTSDGSNIVFNYQDSNQKAEMLYALTPITFMCGFKSFEHIANTFKKTIPTLWNTYFSKTNTIKDFFHTLYHLPKEEITRSAQKLSENKNLLDNLQKEVFEEIYPKYNDPGIFAPLFLNVSQLQLGQAIYLEPGILHAYIKGNGIELMNNSDNVLRAGLTQKHIDINELEHVMNTTAYYPVPMTSTATKEGKRFETPSGFTLTAMEHNVFEISNKGIKLFICTEGTALLDNIELAKGQCCIAGIDAYNFNVDATNARVFMASN